MTIEIQKVQSSEMYDAIEEVANEIYEPILGYKGVASGVGYRSNIDTSYVVNDGDAIVGFYLLKPRNLEEYFLWEYRLDKHKFDFKRLKNLKGIEGVALGLKKEYRGRGIGKKLIEMPKKLGYDYVWGAQEPKLDNLRHWLKRREAVVTGATNVTIEIYKK